jgi:hypothetical protein
MAERFIEVDYSRQEGFIVRVRPNRFKLLPESTREHLVSANKEFLLAIRSLVDETISRIEAREKAGPKQPRRVPIKEEKKA